MDWIAAKSYYIGYQSIDRFYSISFAHNYLLTWSTALLCSFILPFLYLVAPGSLRTTRTTHFLLVCIVCLSYMLSLFIQAYMMSSKGEPALSFHACRFVVYISSFAKPIGIYLTLLFSVERLFTKILAKVFFRTKTNRQLLQRLYALLILLSLTSILSKRLYDVFKLLPANQSFVLDEMPDLNIDSITDTSANSTDRNITFIYCFNTISIDTYAKILSFYVIQYWFEYLAFVLLIALFFFITIQQCCLSRARQANSLHRFSVNTKLYLSLSSCVIGSESVLLFFHFVVDDRLNNNTTIQVVALQFMLFAFGLRCFVLPIFVCLVMCDPLKQLLYELVILRPYAENVDENDTMQERPEPFSATQRSRDRLRQKLRRPFKTNSSKNNHHFENDDAQADL